MECRAWNLEALGTLSRSAKPPKARPNFGSGKGTAASQVGFPDSSGSCPSAPPAAESRRGRPSLPFARLAGKGATDLALWRQGEPVWRGRKRLCPAAGEPSLTRFPGGVLLFPQRQEALQLRGSDYRPASRPRGFPASQPEAAEEEVGLVAAARPARAVARSIFPPRLPSEDLASGLEKPSRNSRIPPRGWL